MTRRSILAGFAMILGCNPRGDALQRDGSRGKGVGVMAGPICVVLLLINLAGPPSS